MCVCLQLKALLMAAYFAADHMVWAHQIGIATDKLWAERWQKLSLWSWALGSVCSAVVESYLITDLSSQQRKGETAEEWDKRKLAIRDALNQRTTTLVHALLQV
jgi:TorA maturation chaperone TorD